MAKNPERPTAQIVNLGARRAESRRRNDAPETIVWNNAQQAAELGNTAGMRVWQNFIDNGPTVGAFDEALHAAGELDREELLDLASLCEKIKQGLGVDAAGPIEKMRDKFIEAAYNKHDYE